MNATVNLQMSTIGFPALVAYLKWKSGSISTANFQGLLNSLGYDLDMTKPTAEISLTKNLLTELE